MMHVHVEHEWHSKRVRVWLYQGEPGSNILLHRLDGAHEVLEPYSALTEPTMVLAEDALKALVEAGTEYEPPSASMARHLDDAIEVRDRLLTLVEGKQP